MSPTLLYVEALYKFTTYDIFNVYRLSYHSELVMGQVRMWTVTENWA